MKKRLSIGTLAFALAFGLAATACGNGAGSGAVGGPNVGGGGNGGGNGAAGGSSISIAGMTTSAEIASAINAALAAGDVTVTGAAVGITDGDIIRPNVPVSRTLNWQADARGLFSLEAVQDPHGMLDWNPKKGRHANIQP